MAHPGDLPGVLSGIALATLLSGWRHGIALLVAFGFVVGYAIMPPPFSLSLDDGASALQLVLYIAVGGLIVFLLASLLDLLRLLEAETELRQTLFHELRHRVANNMQVVALSLHNARRAVSDPAALQAIDETSARVAALGALHRRLYDSAAYQSGLATILGDALSETLRGLPVDIRINIDAGALSIDQMTAILLLVNEAAMNAAKHVFRPGRGRVFEVSLVDGGAGGCASSSSTTVRGWRRSLENCYPKARACGSCRASRVSSAVRSK